MKSLLTIFLLCLIIQPLSSQDHTYENINSSVYLILEYAELKGLIPPMGAVKPYSEYQIYNALSELQKRKLSLTPRERKIIKEFINKFDKKNMLPMGINLSIESEQKADLISQVNHSYNSGILSLKDSFFNTISYDINLGITWDSINPEAFEPYTFTKKSDGFHIWFGDTKYDVNETRKGFSFFTHPELALSLFEDNLNVRLSRVRRNWGEGHSSLLLSETARPFTAMDIRWKLNKWITFWMINGSLGISNDASANADEHQKNLTAHYLEITPHPSITLTAFDASIWGKRDEISYKALMPTFLTQQIVGDKDNVAQGGTLTLRYPGLGKFYCSLFIDEMENDEWSNFFHHNKNQYAWNTGIKTVIPHLSFGTFHFQYTKIEPFTYSHYAQPYPNYTSAINTNFTHDNENLAYYLPPNSDEFFIKIETIIQSGIFVSLQYQHIRHGDNPGKPYGVRGDINENLDYNNLELYLDKNFLHDGIYEFINIVTLKGGYEFATLPLTFEAGYSYVSCKNYKNITDNTVNKNIISLSLNYSLH